MKRFLLFFLLLISSQVFSQAWSTRESWVTKYLKDGGDIKNITGLVRPDNWQELGKWHNIDSEPGLPKHFDWNDYFELQPIRNQGSCGSCWAFSVTAVVESLYWIKNGSGNNNWYDLAEQTLVSNCCSAGSCSGGYFSALDYIRDKGLPHEKNDPYKAQNSSCKKAAPLQRIIEWSYVGDNNRGPTIDQIKTAIFLYGPVSVDVNASFGNYGSGVFNSCGATGSNHMVVLDGWTDDDTYSQNGGGYWRMRNSWGKDWGDNGYMNIVYKSKNGSKCNGIGATTAYAIIKDLEPQAALMKKVLSLQLKKGK